MAFLLKFTTGFSGYASLFENITADLSAEHWPVYGLCLGVDI
jgi:hypothetical protein